MNLQKITDEFLQLFNYDDLTEDQKQIYNEIGINCIHSQKLEHIKRMFEVVMLCSELIMLCSNHAKYQGDCNKLRRQFIKLDIMFYDNSLANKLRFEKELSCYINSTIDKDCNKILDCFKRSFMSKTTLLFVRKLRPFKTIPITKKPSKKWFKIHNVVYKDLTVIRTTKEHIERLKGKVLSDKEITQRLAIQLKLVKKEF